MTTEQPAGQAERPAPEPDLLKVVVACVMGVLLPGLGHALLRKWDRAAVFFGTITLMFFVGLGLEARLFSPDLSDFFAALKFLADAGNGLLYWVCWLRSMGLGQPTAYTYDFGNLFVFGAGLLNMLVVVDAFDIAMGRKK
ncbi:MAG: DUF6677 family protein [Acidobacteriota bacterium]